MMAYIDGHDPIRMRLLGRRITEVLTDEMEAFRELVITHDDEISAIDRLPDSYKAALFKEQKRQSHPKFQPNPKGFKR